MKQITHVGRIGFCRYESNGMCLHALSQQRGAQCAKCVWEKQK